MKSNLILALILRIAILALTGGFTWLTFIILFKFKPYIPINDIALVLILIIVAIIVGCVVMIQMRKVTNWLYKANS